MHRHFKPIFILLLLALAQTAFSWARFQCFLDQNVNPADDPGGEIQINFYYSGSDTLLGAVHYNDYIRLLGYGYPRFLGPVSTSREDFWPLWIDPPPPPDPDIFEGGLWLNYPDSGGIPYPPPDDKFHDIRYNSSIVIPDSAYVDSLEASCELATTLRIRDTQFRVEQWLYDYFTPDNDTIYCDEFFTPGDYHTLPNGSIYLPGKLFLEGWLEGQLTIMASDTIWLIDDVYYADVAFDGVNWIGNPTEDEKGMPPAGSPNRLGIISEKNVIVAFTAQNGGYNGAGGGPGGGCPATDGVADNEHIVINAVVMALDNVFEVDFWHNSCTQDWTQNPYGLPAAHPCNTGMQDLRGNIYLWGGIIQQRHGFVRRSPIGPYGNRFIGYDQRYHWDENFAISYPPRFPSLWDTLQVPLEFPTIQSAIDSAGIGDMILVAPGVYPENLVIDSKDIFISSHYQPDGDPSFIEETVIDGGGEGAVILMRECNYMLTRISGFTLTNGSGFLPDTSNSTYGGGICCLNCDPTLESLIITGNNATCGGGIYFKTDNYDMRSTMSQVTVTGNTAEYGGGFAGPGGVFMSNSILWDNSPEEIHQNIDAVCCNIQGGWWGENNIDADPRFCNPGGGHYRLLPDSPCRSDNCGVIGYTAAACDPEEVNRTVSQPATLSLSQNYPNPFNPETVIEFSLPFASEVELIVYNIRGQVVNVIQSGFMQAGSHSLIWNPQGLPSGVYMYRLTAGEQMSTRKMVLIR